MNAGYSGTPLAKKLGIKEGFVVLGVNLPENYRELISPLPEGVEIVEVQRAGVDMVHLFTNGRDELLRGLSEFKDLIKPAGMIWVSWYKKAAKLPTEITEDDVRDTALALGLVDVKVCPVDERWSGLKVVIRVENREK